MTVITATVTTNPFNRCVLYYFKKKTVRLTRQYVVTVVVVTLKGTKGVPRKGVGASVDMRS